MDYPTPLLIHHIQLFYQEINLLKYRYTFDTLQEHGCFIGSAAVIIISDKVQMKDVAINLMKFFEEESCGQCTPCRNGTTMAVKLMNENNWDLKLLTDVGNVMTDASICGLGQAAANPLFSVIKHFAGDLKSI